MWKSVQSERTVLGTHSKIILHINNINFSNPLHMGGALSWDSNLRSLTYRSITLTQTMVSRVKGHRALPYKSICNWKVNCEAIMWAILRIVSYLVRRNSRSVGSWELAWWQFSKDSHMRSQGPLIKNGLENQNRVELLRFKILGGVVKERYWYWCWACTFKGWMALEVIKSIVIGNTFIFASYPFKIRS